MRIQTGAGDSVGKIGGTREGAVGAVPVGRGAVGEIKGCRLNLKMVALTILTVKYR